MPGDAWGRVLKAVHIPVLVAVWEGEHHAWPHVAVVGRRRESDARDGNELGVEDLVGDGWRSQHVANGLYYGGRCR